MRRRQLLFCALVGHGSVNRWLARPTLYSCTACCMLHANGFVLHVVSATYCSPYCVLSITCCMMCCASQQPTKTEQSIVRDRNARSCRVLSVLRRMLRSNPRSGVLEVRYETCCCVCLRTSSSSKVAAVLHYFANCSLLGVAAQAMHGCGAPHSGIAPHRCCTRSMNWS
jgi:hypothetical protein